MRNIAVGTGNSRPKISEIIKKSKGESLEPCLPLPAEIYLQRACETSCHVGSASSRV